ncbi:uncharacterized protein V6R79_025356 [Siganus canaliculatus]
MVRCVLCHRREETPRTGPLSTKDGVTAHQNCLLYASAIWIVQDSPQYDDLFGFSPEDVLKEAKRGKRLVCSHCRDKGATVGCEVKRCQKSYHYPCAIEAGAESVEDQEQEKYYLYCSNHLQHRDENGRPKNGRVSPSIKLNTLKDPSGAGPSKVYCLTCERAEGNISLDNISNVILLYCDKHPPLPHKRADSVDSATAGPLGYSSDSNSSSSMKRRTSKRQLRFTDDEKDYESSASLTSENQAHSVPKHGNGNEDDTDAGSVSLLSLVRNRAESPPAASTAHPETILIADSEVSGPEQRSLPDPKTGSSGLHPSSSASDPEPSIDAATFWENCNVAGCTQAVFTDFIHDMNNLSDRIQSHQASQEEYDLALTVMKASGKLARLVKKQQKELQRKQMELQKATAAMQEVISALK